MTNSAQVVVVPLWAKSVQQPGRLADLIRDRFIMLLIVEALALDLLALPVRLSFESHLLRDQAETLGFHYLLGHGYILNRDIGYQYGLLNLLLPKLWFA